MYAISPSTPRRRIASGVLAMGNSLRVAAFTLTSVACADRITATSNSKGDSYVSSVFGAGIESRRRSKICCRFVAFMRWSCADSSVVPRASATTKRASLLTAQLGRARQGVETCVVRIEARAEFRCARRIAPRLVGPIFVSDEFDAIDRTDRHAQLTPGALARNHGMHVARGADDRVDRTRRKTQRAADAARLVDCDDARR